MAQSMKDLLKHFVHFSFSCSWGKKTGEAPHSQQMGGAMDKECVGGANNNMATNYTVNGSAQKDSVP